MAVPECETIDISHRLPLGLVACSVSNSKALQEEERSFPVKSMHPLAGYLV
jgi:hypothetical protein